MVENLHNRMMRNIKARPWIFGYVILFGGPLAALLIWGWSGMPSWVMFVAFLEEIAGFVWLGTH
ncbi:MAG: hypothetical protein M0Z50_03190 [Planctomycetia bacterium]|nr:hypothetical protein [Planctomycetia bacterium]